LTGSSKPRRVAVTGIGVVTALGDDPVTLWSALLDGRSAVGPIRRFDASGFPTRIAAEIPDAPATPLRIAAFAQRAARSALDDAGLRSDSRYEVDPARLGVVTASGVASFAHEEVFGATAAAAPDAVDGPLDVKRFAHDFRSGLGEAPFDRLSPGALAAAVAHSHGILGPVASVDTACAAGAQALGDAARWIRLGLADVVVAGPREGVGALLDDGTAPEGVTVAGDRAALDRLRAATRTREGA
jgi:3-oxoacyl-(acyl-carrier-protein) synthase